MTAIFEGNRSISCGRQPVHRYTVTAAARSDLEAEVVVVAMR